MAEANAINAATTGIVGNTGTAFTGTAVTNHAVIVGGSTSSTLTNVGPTATAGQVLQSAGSSADPAFSTATYPTTATGTGTILRADGTNWVATTSTYPNTNAVSTLLYASSANVMSALATANSATLTTNSSGVPTWVTAGTSWTPGISFGGGTTGITYTTQSGEYVRIGPLFFYRFAIVLSSKGSSTGQAAVTGWPLSAITADSYNLLTGYTNLTLTNISAVQFLPNSSNTTFLMSTISTAGAAASLTDTSFANNTVLQGYGVYFVA